MRFIALSVIALLCAQYAIAGDTPSQIGIYYSFEQSPPAAVFSQFQAEFQLILAPIGLPVQWREISGAKSEEFRDIFVIRFHGSCSLKGEPDEDRGLNPDERSLAETQVSNGQVLPFADVKCDSLRRYLGFAPLATTAGGDVFGRALARVAAHELYHMMTASRVHHRIGIARAEYSRGNLTAPRLVFGVKESQWLRSWAAATNLAKVSPITFRR